MITKVCTKCEMELDESFFYKRNASKDGLYHMCKSCYSAFRREYRKNNAQKMLAQSRKNNLWVAYRITTEDYNKMLQEQDGGCIGLMNDNLDTVKAAVDYLETSKEKIV